MHRGRLRSWRQEGTVQPSATPYTQSLIEAIPVPDPGEAETTDTCWHQPERIEDSRLVGEVSPGHFVFAWVRRIIKTGQTIDF